jgi:hypothetical protein
MRGDELAFADSALASTVEPTAQDVIVLRHVARRVALPQAVLFWFCACKNRSD